MYCHYVCMTRMQASCLISVLQSCLIMHHVMLQVPMLVVFGKPLELPKIKNPSDDEVQKYLQMYIEAMEALCEKHKNSAGYGNTIIKVV